MKNCRMIPLSELTISITSGLNTRKDFVLNDVDATEIYLNVKDLDELRGTTNNIQILSRTNRITKEASAKIQQKSNLEYGDILISSLDSSNKLPVFVDCKIVEFSISENIYAIKPDSSKIRSKYLYYAFMLPIVKQQLFDLTASKTLLMIPKSKFREILIPVPDINEQIRIENEFNKLFELQEIVTKMDKCISNEIKNTTNSINNTTSCQTVEDTKKVLFDLAMQVANKTKT